MIETPVLEIHPLTPERWSDLEELFGPQGTYTGGCWCMFWRLRRSNFTRTSAEDRKASLKALVLAGQPPGVLAYLGEKPIGWCSLAPRYEYLALEYSRTIRPVDDYPVWSITCFFIARSYRRQGVMNALIQGALEYARSQGARIVEAYPTDTHAQRLAGKKLTGYSGYMGIVSAFRKAGFVEAGRVSETQLIMRYIFP